MGRKYPYQHQTPPTGFQAALPLHTPPRRDPLRLVPCSPSFPVLRNGYHEVTVEDGGIEIRSTNGNGNSGEDGHQTTRHESCPAMQESIKPWKRRFLLEIHHFRFQGSVKRLGDVTTNNEGESVGKRKKIRTNQIRCLFRKLRQWQPVTLSFSLRYSLSFG